jgi:glycosyltransferase involved in cell wall biosynthesis
MRALMLAAETPYPLAGGGALRTASLLHYLASRYETELLVFCQPGAPDPGKSLPQGLVARAGVLQLQANSRNLSAKIVRNGIRLVRGVPPLVDRFAGFEWGIRKALEGRRYAVGVVEHFWCAPYADVLRPFCDRLALDLHNVESALHERCAASEGGAAAMAHRAFARASRRLEAEWLPRYDQLLVASAEDARLVGAKATVYPNALPSTPEPPRGDDDAIVFSGNLEYHPNRTAVRWFRREIWPALRERHPGLVWRLVGKNPEAVAALTAGDPRIELVGAVEDAVAEIARARAAVVPLLAGSGTRLKILEAWAAGTPVVSTTIGAEGLGARDGAHLLIADGAPEFAAATSRLLACTELRQSLGRAGRALLNQEFTWETAWRKLDF